MIFRQVARSPNRTVMIMAAFLLLLPSSLSANSLIETNSLSEAERYYKMGDFEIAFEVAYPLAEQGDPGAQYLMAIMLATGRGIKKDCDLAAVWFKDAAYGGYTLAQYVLGQHYEFGDCVPKDFTEAFRWYMKAAFKEQPDAQFKLGWMFENGLGVEENAAKAAVWYARAADNGVMDGQYRLGLLALGGRGVAEDLQFAVRLLSEAAERGFPLAMITMGDLHRDGRGVEKDKSAAVAWYFRAGTILHSAGKDEIAREALASIRKVDRKHPKARELAKLIK